MSGEVVWGVLMKKDDDRIFMQIAGTVLILIMIFGFAAVMIMLGVWMCKGGII